MKSLLYSVWLWIGSDPERSLLALLALLVGTWKALPATLRASLELRFPRAVGTARMVAKLAPDVIGALRVGWYQALKAKPRATPAAPPPSLSDEGTVSQ